MKKSIVSRMKSKLLKSKKAKLAAGVLAIILAMFPSSAKAQTYLVPGVDVPTNVDNDIWVMDPHDKGQTDPMFATGVTASHFYLNYTFGVHYHNMPVYTLQAGHYVSDGSNINVSRLVLGDSVAGTLTVTGYAGQVGVSGNSITEAISHYGGASTLTFENYINNTINGAVMVVGENGNFTLQGQSTNIFGTVVTDQLHPGDQGWNNNGPPYQVNGNGNATYTRDPGNADSYIFFDNNQAANGGAIRVNSTGTLTLDQVIFGMTMNPDVVAAPSPFAWDRGFSYGYGNRAVGANGDGTGLGGAIDNRGTLHLSAGQFYLSTAQSGGAIYNTGTIDERRNNWGLTFELNEATEEGGAIYNSGSFTNYGLWQLNKAELGGAVYNSGTFNADGTFSLNFATDGAAIYNTTTGSTIFTGDFHDNMTVADVNLAGVDTGVIQDYNNARQAYTDASLRLNATGQSLVDAQNAVAAAQNRLTAANTEFTAAQNNFNIAETAFNADPTPANQANFLAAQERLGVATLEQQAADANATAANTSQVAAQTAYDDAQDALWGPDRSGTTAGAFYDLTQAQIDYNNELAGVSGGPVNPNGRGGAVYNQGVFNHSIGHVTGNWAADGGVYYNDGLNSIINLTSGLTIEHNLADKNGGVLYNNRGVLNITGITFDFNDAGLDGGVIYNVNGTVNLNNGNTFGNNSAQRGGAIYSTGGRITVNNNEFNHNVATTGDGGAIYNGGATILTLLNGTKFMNNRALSTSGGRGGAIYNTTQAQVIVNNNNAALFRGNLAMNGGGAIFNEQGGRMSLVGGTQTITFEDNKAGYATLDTDGTPTNAAANGGAIYSSLNGVIVVDNADFSENRAGGSGGAIYNAGNIQGTVPLPINFTITNNRFDSNVADNGNGGAIYNGPLGIINITGTEFAGNVAVNGKGGAIYNDAGSRLTLTDVVFDGNTDSTNGGAIYSDGGTVGTTVNVVVVNGVQAEGSTENQDASFGTENSVASPNETADSITFAGEKNLFNVDVQNQTYSLEMWGRMRSEALSEVDLTKTGIGVWEHHKDSVFSGAITNFAVNDGTFRMKVGSEMNLDGRVALSTSVLTLGTPTHAAVANMVPDVVDPTISRPSSTNYTGTASLILETGSVVTTDRIVTLAGSSIVVGDVLITPQPVGTPTENWTPAFTVTAGRQFSFGSTAVPSAGQIAGNAWDIDGYTTVIASGYSFENPNLGGAAALDAPGLHFENSTASATSGDGPILMLRPTQSGVDVTLDSDIYVTKPGSFAGGGGFIILVEVNNGGTFNLNNPQNAISGQSIATTGDFWVKDGTTYVQGNVTQFQRSPNAGSYNGLTVTPNADNTGEWIIYASVEQSTKSTDLRWTGAVDGMWDTVDLDGATATKNWFGTAAGIPITQFLNGDTVFFEDIVEAAVLTDIQKQVTLESNVAVNAMTVSGTNYVFNLNNSNIAASGTVTPENPNAGNIDFGSATINVARSTGGAAASTVTGSSILFGADGELHFDTVNAVANDTFLSLGTGGNIDLVSDIYIGTPTAALGNNFIYLVKADGSSTLSQTGALYVDNRPITTDVVDRNQDFIGINLIDANDQFVDDNGVALVLAMMDANTNTNDLFWAGVDVNATTPQTEWASGTNNNWRGTVASRRITSFLDGDTVFFADSYNDATGAMQTVANKDVVVAGGGVTVGNMTVGREIKDNNGVVTGIEYSDGYSFDLTAGSITAVDNAVGDGNIDFGTATIIADNGTTITAAGTIHFEGGNDFTLDLTGANTTNPVLSLTATGGVTGEVGGGVVTINNLSGGFTAGQEIILIDAGTNSANTISGSSRLAGAAEFVRVENVADGQNVLGLKTNILRSQLLLTMVNTSDNSERLNWAGTVAGGVWDVNTTTNWAGAVGGHFVNTFLNRDTVYFSDDYLDASNTSVPVAAGNKVVNITAGGVTVGDMVVDGGGYTFNLSQGNLTAVANAPTNAAGNIDFGSARLVADLGSTVTAAGSITFVGGAAGNAFDFDLTGAVDGDTLLTLTAAGGVAGTIGNGVINVNNMNLGINQSVVLVDTGTNYGNIVDTGELWVNGVDMSDQEFERGDTGIFYGLQASGAELLFKVVDGNAVSNNMQWKGGENGNIWDVNVTANWSGSVIGVHVDKFLDGDTVAFDATYVDADGATQNVALADRNVTVAAGGVMVGDMNVNEVGYAFNLAAGGITAQANAASGALGNIAFNAATGINGLGVGMNSVIHAEGDITFAAASRIDLTVGTSSAPLLQAGGNIDITGVVLDFNAYTGHPDDGPITIFDAGGVIAGWTGTRVIGDEDFIYSEASKVNETVVVDTELYWYANAAGEAHGDFTLAAGKEFELGTVLNDRDPADAAAFRPGWDGTTLSKKGDGTLTLSGDNAYSGGTTIEGGRLVADHVNATGTGDVTINGGSTFEIAADGEYENIIIGGNTSNLILGSSADGKLTLTAESNNAKDFTGNVTISEGTVRLDTFDVAGQNLATNAVAINTGALLELGGIAGLTPCATVTTGAEFNKQLTGPGGLAIDGGTIVLTNTDNRFGGGTEIRNGGTLIIDSNAVLGSSNTIDVSDGGNFTIGFAGTFGKVITGNETGTVYINSLRTVADGIGRTILTGNNTYTGDTDICGGIVELRNINATGQADVASTVNMRTAETVLDFNFADSGNYNKVITGLGSVAKRGAGTVTLGGDSSYSGGTTVSAGRASFISKQVVI